ncbi:MAG TPA: hypothetical protein VG797_04205 [Phycisphaerales bacterium]|nr:hypothetical protein [Phycisphaerales bacterium]
MEQVFQAVAQNWFWSVMGLIAIVSIVVGAITSMVNGMGRERSRREIAAYIAEGTMTPEQGERILSAKDKEED